MTACMKANSQRVILTKGGAVTTKRVDDHSPFAMSYNSVNTYLSDPAIVPQRLTITCGQTDIGKKFVSITMNEVSRQTAMELADSKSFEAAFNLADNRKSLHEGCLRAKKFYQEHILYHNPFPPRNKFAVVIEKLKKAKKEAAKPKTEDDLTTTKRTSSTLSLLEGTMSLTSMSSHSQLSATIPSHPINLKTPKKRGSGRFRQQPVDSQMKHKKDKNPKNSTKPGGGTNDENRLMNTFNTSG